MNTNSFRQVKDKANRRVRGLWIRNGKFYVQCTRLDPSTGLKAVTKIILPDAPTLEQAKTDAARVKEAALKGQLVTGDAGPVFKEYREHYRANNHKAPKTAYNENSFLLSWQKFLGEDCRIRQITPQNVIAYRTQLLDCCKPRTANLHLKALKQMLLLAKTEGHIAKLATDGIKQLRVKRQERPLLEEKNILALATEALRNHDRSGEQFADYIAFLMYSGARCSEALKLKWTDVDWDQEQIVFRPEISKGGLRRLDFNKNLKNHLLCMKSKATSDWLFPSERTDSHVKSFKMIMQQIRAVIDVEFSFHLLRHYFISQCVMKGLTFMTIAKWVGHVDGGILIGTVYGHLNNAHMKAEATKL